MGLLLSVPVILRPEELFAVFTILFPTAVAAWAFLEHRDDASVALAAVGCVLHCPFSCALHTHRAVSNDAVVRTVLYKLDVIFIHVHSLCQGTAWLMRLPVFETFFHTICISLILSSTPLETPRVKNTIDILCAVGVMISSFGMIYKSFVLWTTAHLTWTVAFFIHNRKLFGKYSSTIFHAILAGPEFCLLAATAMPLEP